MTSNHEGVSCDSCRKNNFKGLRYKCLICYDYDLCSACYEANLTSSRHTVNHPTQCIVARNDFDLFYSGESITSEQPQSLTCPLCGGLGFTESTLLEHVTNEHAQADNDESSAGIVCPICGVETNQLTYDFATHLTMEHRTPRDPIEQVAIRGRGGRCHTRASGPRGRRPHHFSGLGGSSPSARDSTDPLVEMLAQLSGAGIRRAGSSSQSAASQLHQLQMHLQSPSFSPRTGASERNEVRIMRRTFQSMNNQLNHPSSNSAATVMPGIGTDSNVRVGVSPFDMCMVVSGAGGLPPGTTSGSGLPLTNHLVGNTDVNGTSPQSSQYLLSAMKSGLTETEQQQKEILKADKSLFVQDLLLQIGLITKDK